MVVPIRTTVNSIPIPLLQPTCQLTPVPALHVVQVCVELERWIRPGGIRIQCALLLPNVPPSWPRLVLLVPITHPVLPTLASFCPTLTPLYALPYLSYLLQQIFDHPPACRNLLQPPHQWPSKCAKRGCFAPAIKQPPPLQCNYTSIPPA